MTNWIKGHHPDFGTFYPCWVYDAGGNVALARWDGPDAPGVWKGGIWGNNGYYVGSDDVVAWRMMEMPTPPRYYCGDWLGPPPPDWHVSKIDLYYIYDGEYVTVSMWRENTWTVGGFAFDTADVTHYQPVVAPAPPVWAAEKRETGILFIGFDEKRFEG